MKRISERGVVLYGVMAAVAAVTILLVALNQSILGERRIARRLVEKSRLRQEALGIADLVISLLRQECTLKGSLGRTVMDSREPVELGHLIQPRVREIFDSMGRSPWSSGTAKAPEISLSLTAQRLHYLVDPSITGLGFDSGECRGRFNVSVRVSRGWYSSEVRVRVPYTVASILAPVVSKFTLFAARAGESAGKGEGYNILPITIDGTPDRGDTAPLVLVNYPDLNLSPPSQGNSQAQEPGAGGKGFVYLGGGPVELNIASGSSGNGEDFLFYDTGVTAMRPFYMTASDRPASLTGTFAAGREGSPVQSWHLLHKIHGFFTSDSTALRRGLEGESAYYEYFRDRTSEPLKGAGASVLHLFGTNDRRTPTRVYGNVKARFGILSAIGVDIDAGLSDEESRGGTFNDVDGLSLFLPMASEKTFSRALGQNPSYPFRRPPEWIKNGNQPGHPVYGTIFIDTEASLPGNLFRDFREYSRYMSRIMEMPYQCLVAFMTYSRIFPPWRDAGFSLHGKAPWYPDKQGAQTGPFPAELTETGSFCELPGRPSEGPGGPYYSGNLRSLSLDWIERKVQITYPSQKEFFKAHLRGDTLTLGAVIRVQGPLYFSSDLEVMSGGMVIAENDIRLPGVICRSEQPVTFVSLRGNLVLLPGKTIQAGMAALGSSARLELERRAGSGPLDIQGHLAVTVLDPSVASRGGRISYDPRFDPTCSGAEKALVAAVTGNEEVFNEAPSGW